MDRAKAALRDERAFTLPELLVGIVGSLIVIGAALTVLSLAVRAQPNSTERAAQIQSGRVLIERITRELRQGEGVLSPTPTGFSMITWVNSSPCGGAAAATSTRCRVTYACSSSACTRTERNPDGTGSAAPETVVAGITGPNVFTYAPADTDATYVGVELVYPQDDGAEAVTLSDGVALRNWFDAEA